MRAWVPILLSVSLTGCSVWETQEPNSVPRLPRTRMSKDSVGIEVATVTLDISEVERLVEIRSAVDEQILPLEQRRSLASNGILVGLVGTQVSPALQLLLMEAEHRLSHPTADAIADGPDEHRFVQSRAGKQIEVGLWPATRTWSATHRDEGLATVAEYHDAVGKVGIVCQPDANSTAKLKLCPELEHGPLKQKYVAKNGSFHIESRRDRVRFDDLAVELNARPGEILLMTCDDGDANSVGARFFRNVDGSKQKILLVRLAQTQVDFSFDEEYAFKIHEYNV